MKTLFWHWPDRIIRKRESRRLREEHNALANSHAELLEALEAAQPHTEDMLMELEKTDDLSDRPFIQRARAAITKAKELQP